MAEALVAGAPRERGLYSVVRAAARACAVTRREVSVRYNGWSGRGDSMRTSRLGGSTDGRGAGWYSARRGRSVLSTQAKAYEPTAFPVNWEPARTGNRETSLVPR